MTKSRLFIALVCCCAVFSGVAASRLLAEEAQPAKLADVQLTIVVKEDDLGDPKIFARFQNRADRPQTIVRPVDGSMYGHSMPYYRLTAKTAEGEPLETEPPLCAFVSGTGLYAGLKWPEDYTVEIPPGEQYDRELHPPFELTSGEEYELQLTYIYEPTEKLEKLIEIPDSIGRGKIQGAASTIIAPKSTDVYPLHGLESDTMKWPAEVKRPPDVTITWLRKNRLLTDSARYWGASPWIDSDRQIRHLGVHNLSIGQDDLSCICGLSDLKEIIFSDVTLSTADLSPLGTLGDLRLLHFSDMELDEKVLLSVRRIMSLRKLELKHVDVSDDAIAKLKRMKPGLIIERKHTRKEE